MNDRQLHQVCRHYGLRGIHPVGMAYPMMTGNDFAALRKDIAAHGLWQPIAITHDRYILDGKCRLIACYLEGIEPTFRTLDPVYEQDYSGFVERMNGKRQHLTTDQIAIILKRAAALQRAAAVGQEMMNL